jgi:hypothetical protein
MTSGLGSEQARDLAAEVGFLLVPGAPYDRGPAYLLVGLRRSPTLAHFDPERIDYWAVQEGRSLPAELRWPALSCGEPYGWGTITILDRLAVENRFCSFGGTLSASRDRDLCAVLFRSDAPILAIGGHSVAADRLAIHMAGFFGQLRAAAGRDRALADSLDEAEPMTVYAAYLAHSLTHLGAGTGLSGGAAHLVSVVRSELHRIELLYPFESRAGARIARSV